ncbi:MAG: S-layer homology domain-containing protein, partial [Lachnospiraceae bacterium]|nr:S-layer homology domain-containing protein [Lachnospiraceae bacterium]
PKAWPFTDIPEQSGAWKYDNVKYVYENGIMNGISGTTLFNPDGKLDRAMFATVLHRMAKTPAVAYTDKFSDVKQGKYYTSAILWAAEKKIVSGLSDGSYGVTDNITREQIAKMLYEYAKTQNYDISGAAVLDSFTDTNKVGIWAVNYMKWAVDAGMISGKPNGDGTFRLDPKGAATRAECAKMLTMFLQKYQAQ